MTERRSIPVQERSKKIEMPPEGVVPPILQDQSHLYGSSQQEEAAQEVADLNMSVPDKVDHIFEDQDQQEVQDDQDAHDSEPETAQQQEAPRKAESKREENWRTIRDAKEKAERDRERAERERDALMQRLIEIETSKSQRQYQEQEPEPDYNFDIEDDALLEGKHAKKMLGQMKQMKRQIDQYQSMSQQNAVETKLKQQFPDFDTVVSRENVEILNEEFPEVAASLRDTQDLYTKGSAAYKIIKRMGIYRDNGDIMAQKAKVIQNLKKPKSVAAVAPQQSDSPLTKVSSFDNEFSETLRKQLHKEMIDAMKRR